MNEEEIAHHVIDPVLERNRQLIFELDEIERTLVHRKKSSGISYYIPNKKQLEFHKSTARNIMLLGSNRAGKTHALVSDFIMHATGNYMDWYPEEKKLYHAPKLLFIALSFEAIKKYIEPKFNSLLPSDLIKGTRRASDGHITQYTIKHVTGNTSQIDFSSQEQDSMAFEGSDYDLAGSDEPLKRYIFIAVSRGLVDRGGRFLFAMTPIIQPWMKEELCDKADGKFCDVIHSVMTDNLEDIEGNPILTKEAIKFFEGLLTEDEKEMRLYGRWFHMSGIVYKEFDQGVHVIDDAVVDKSLPVFFVLDPHDRNPHCGIWAYVDKTDDVVICDELIQGGTPEEYSKAVLSLEKERGYKIRKRIIDPNFGNKPQSVGSRIRVVDQFRNSGLKNMILGIDDDEAGKLRVRSYLKFDRSKKVDISNKPKIFFFKQRAFKTWRAISNLQYADWQKKTSEDRELKESVKDKNKHFSDTLRYLLLSNPKYERTYSPEEVDKPIY